MPVVHHAKRSGEVTVRTDAADNGRTPTAPSAPPGPTFAKRAGRCWQTPAGPITHGPRSSRGHRSKLLLHQCDWALDGRGAVAHGLPKAPRRCAAISRALGNARAADAS